MGVLKGDYLTFNETYCSISFQSPSWLWYFQSLSGNNNFLWFVLQGCTCTIYHTNQIRPLWRWISAASFCWDGKKLWLTVLSVHSSVLFMQVKVNWRYVCNNGKILFWPINQIVVVPIGPSHYYVYVTQMHLSTVVHAGLTAVDVSVQAVPKFVMQQNVLCPDLYLT